MGLPPQLGASSRRVRCRLSVRSQAIHPAAGSLLRRGRSITPLALYYAAGAFSPQVNNSPQAINSPQALLRRGLFISPRAINSPRAIHLAAGAPGSNCTIAAICRETAMSAPLLENIRPFSTR